MLNLIVGCGGTGLATIEATIVPRQMTNMPTANK